MQELAVIDDTHLDDDLSASIARLTHSETLQSGLLIARLVEPPNASSRRPSNPLLQRGFFQHRRLQKPYYLNRVVYWTSLDQVGVWYTALYQPENDLGPHWFRPLHTEDGKGWLDPDEKAGRLSRFQRINHPKSPR